MSPPIRDGSGNDIGAIRLGDGSEISEVRTGAGGVLFSAVPASQVIRSQDNDLTNRSGDAGVVVNPNVDLNGLKAEISASTTNATTAYIRDSSDNILAQTDISSLTSGDTFRVDGVNMTSGSDFLLTLDAGGASFTIGFHQGAALPFSTQAFDIPRQRNDRDAEDTDDIAAVNNIRTLNF